MDIQKDDRLRGVRCSTDGTLHTATWYGTQDSFHAYKVRWEQLCSQLWYMMTIHCMGITHYIVVFQSFSNLTLGLLNTVLDPDTYIFTDTDEVGTK